jgi:hypothetical protein
MWQKLMRTWLVGAAVTLATPEGALRAETNSPVDEMAGIAESTTLGAIPASGNIKRPLTLTEEPMLGDLLGDPICLALMRRDGVTPEYLDALLAPLRNDMSKRRTSEDL